MAVSALALVVAWALFAFGAVYPWTSIPLIVAAPLLCVFSRPAIFARGTRLLDAALCLMGVSALAQIVPLPPGLWRTLSPSATDFVQRTTIGTAPMDVWRPLSLVPSESCLAAGLLIAAILIFWSARGVAASRGLRRLVRTISWMGLVAAIMAIAQPVLFGGGKVYGFWRPESIEARPLGPIISRNHFAAWMLLALPLAAGYLVAHARARWPAARRALVAVVFGDGRAMWLGAATALMAASILISQSRSGVIGLLAALSIAMLLGWRRLGVAGRVGLVSYLVLLAILVPALSNPRVVATRFDRALDDTWGGRPEIWRETTIYLVKPYWQTGTGVGTFDVVMSVYQTATRAVFFNHAHNQYLNFFAEGGVLVTAPAALAALAFAGVARRRLRQDASALGHIRHGALAGLAGLMVQSIWETPLLTPAVLVLAAVSAGIAASYPHVADRPRAAHD